MRRLSIVLAITIWLCSINDAKARVMLPTCPPPPIQIQFMASTTSWTNAEYVGHAFMCISIPLNAGVKEDCFGFYPKPGGRFAFVGGPGVTEPEFVKKPSRFSRVTVSVKNSITEEQRRRVLKLTNAWNAKTYDLTDQSCIDFVNSIAQALSWATPDRVSTDLPETFLRKLADANP